MTDTFPVFTISTKCCQILEKRREEGSGKTSYVTTLDLTGSQISAVIVVPKRRKKKRLGQLSNWVSVSLHNESISNMLLWGRTAGRTSHTGLTACHPYSDWQSEESCELCEFRRYKPPTIAVSSHCYADDTPHNKWSQPKQCPLPNPKPRGKFMPHQTNDARCACVHGVCVCVFRKAQNLLGPEDRIYPHRGLIQDEELWALKQRRSQRHPALLAATEKSMKTWVTASPKINNNNNIFLNHNLSGK